MARIRRILIMLASTCMVLAVVPAAVLSTHVSAIAAETHKAAAVSGHPTRPYPPEAGLRLLEDILMRIRSSPQLAMARQNARMQSDELAQAKSGPTDYRLAIKPRDIAKPAAPAADDDAREGGQIASASGAVGARRLGIWESSEAARSKTANMPETITPSGDDAKGLWEKDNQGLSPESQRRLSQSLGGLFNVLSKTAQAQKMAANVPQVVPYGGSLSSGYSGGTPVRSMTRGALEEAPIHGTTLKAARTTSFSAKKAAGKLAAPRRYEVAMLPPNVVTGIPSVRLGCSEGEACAGLSQLGAGQKRSVNGWTIWTYERASSPVLQIYVKHGQVEALRVFDSSLLSPELGIRVGDDLSLVKERFGEPAFMLSEPLSGAGQNYIYPLSQVGFLFTRPSGAAPPAVAGLLIFNVKW